MPFKLPSYEQIITEAKQAQESYVPDCLFPTSNDWEIPDLRADMQAEVCDIPFVCFGEQARTFQMNGCGTLHFYTDDYRYGNSLYEHPEKILKHNPRNIVEPNYSLFNETPAAFGLREIYKKRFIARALQEKGIRIFVDLNVAQKWYKLNFLGVPAGWRSFCTRGYSDRIQALEFEYRIAEASAALSGSRPLFVCYGGGRKCKDFCREVHAVYVTPIVSIKKKEKAWEQLKKDDCILFMDGDFSLKAIEAQQERLRLNQVQDFVNHLNRIENE
ncbi:MAG: DUF4417 domain-containing protein [Bacteroidales bacterium]|nr:DUF4417 domain-containing protein [Candidatus Egerieousia equi]